MTITRCECFVDEYIHGDSIDNDEDEDVHINHQHMRTITTIITTTITIAAMAAIAALYRFVGYDWAMESEEYYTRCEVSV